MITADTLQKKLEEKVINFSLLQYGKPYVHKSMGPDSFDCVTLAWYIYTSLFDIDLFQMGFGNSATTLAMTSCYGKITLYPEGDWDKDLSILHSGDILFFHTQSLKDHYPKPNNRYPGHCGIYLENNYFIQANRTKGKVVISNFNKNEYWKRVLVGSKNVITDLISYQNSYPIEKEKSLIR